MEDKIDISCLISKVTENVGHVKWVDPRCVTGLPSKNKVIELEQSSDWDESISDELYDYVEKWFEYAQSSAYIDDDNPKTPIERYVESMLYIFINYHNSVAGLFSLSPEKINVEDARRCLPIFEEYLATKQLTDFERETVQMYLTDFYQLDDLWSPAEGRFYDEFSDEENSLLVSLARMSQS